MKVFTAALCSTLLIVAAACSEADRQNIKDALTPDQDVEVSESGLNEVGCRYQTVESSDGEPTVDLNEISCDDDGVESLELLQDRSAALNSYLQEIAKGLETKKITDSSKEVLLQKQKAGGKLKIVFDAKLAVRGSEYFNYEGEYNEETKGRLLKLAEVVLREDHNCYIDYDQIDCDSTNTPSDTAKLLVSLRNFKEAHKLFEDPDTAIIRTASESIVDIKTRKASVDGFGAAWGTKRSDLTRNITVIQLKSNRVSYMSFNGILSPDSDQYSTPAEILAAQRDRFEVYRESFQNFQDLDQQVQLDMLLAGVLSYDSYRLQGSGLESGTQPLAAGLTEFYSSEVGYYLVETMKHLEKLYQDFSDELKVSTYNQVGEMLSVGVEALRIVDKSYVENQTTYVVYRTPYYDYINSRLIQMRQSMLSNNCKIPSAINIALWNENSFVDKWGSLSSVSVTDMTAAENQAVDNANRLQSISSRLQNQWRDLYNDDSFLSKTDAWYTLKGQSFAAAVDTQLEVLQMALDASKESFGREREILATRYAEIQQGQHCTK